MSGGPLLAVDELVLRFGGITAIDGVSFELHAGELLALIGPNGAGKTSILNCLNGVYRPQRGSIRLDGAELVGAAPSAIAGRGVARTFQSAGLFEQLTALDNLMLGRHRLMRTGLLAGMAWWGRARREEVEHREAVERVAQLLALEPYRDVQAGRLPAGVRKRVELGRALAMEPRVLLMDEPLSGLGHEEGEAMGRCIADARERLGVAVILVDHHMELVMELADRVMALDFGRRIALGTAAEVQADEHVIASYLGRATA